MDDCGSSRSSVACCRPKTLLKDLCKKCLRKFTLMCRTLDFGGDFPTHHEPWPPRLYERTTEGWPPLN